MLWCQRPELGWNIAAFTCKTWHEIRRRTVLLQGGRSLLSLKGKEERKPITSHFSSPYHTFLLFITLPLLLFLCLFALKLSFVVTLPHLLPSRLASRPRQILLTGSSWRESIRSSLCVFGVGTQLEILLGFSRRSAPLRPRGRLGRRSGWRENGRKGEGGKITKTSRQRTAAVVWWMAPEAIRLSVLTHTCAARRALTVTYECAVCQTSTALFIITSAAVYLCTAWVRDHFHRLPSSILIRRVTVETLISLQ